MKTGCFLSPGKKTKGRGSLTQFFPSFFFPWENNREFFCRVPTREGHYLKFPDTKFISMNSQPKSKITAEMFIWWIIGSNSNWHFLIWPNIDWERSISMSNNFFVFCADFDWPKLRPARFLGLIFACFPIYFTKWYFLSDNWLFFIARGKKQGTREFDSVFSLGFFPLRK